MNIEKIIKEKIKLIQNAVKESGTKGFVFGNSGGKDSCLAGLLLKLSGVATVGIAMPCGAKRNYAIDKIDGVALANALGIKSIVVSLTDEYLSLRKKLGEQFGEPLTQEVEINIPPRLRMLTLYAYSQANSFLVAGTGNRSEFYLGYFTKWGDGGFDIPLLVDLTVKEIYEILNFIVAELQKEISGGKPNALLQALPANTKPQLIEILKTIIAKQPSAGLHDEQTDEGELGFTYTEVDDWLLNGKKGANHNKIMHLHKINAHKRWGALDI